MNIEEAIDLLNTTCRDIIPENQLDFKLVCTQPLVLSGNFYIVGNVSFDICELEKHSKNAKEFLNFIKQRIRYSQHDALDTLLQSMRSIN